MLRNRIGVSSMLRRIPNVVLTASIVAMSLPGTLWAQPAEKSDKNAVSSEAVNELDRGRIEKSTAVLNSKVVSD